MNQISVAFDAAQAPQISLAVEQPRDIAARDALLDRAMVLHWRRKASEKLRRGRLPAEGLAFVAKDEAGSLVGTVRLWDVTFEAGPGSTGGWNRPLLLGPLAVDPAFKSAGIGSALMRHAIEAARNLGHGAILLVGDASYYARFGFSADKTGRLAMPGPYQPERFLALELVEGVLDGARGVVQPAGRRLPAQQFKAVA